MTHVNDGTVPLKLKVGKELWLWPSDERRCHIPLLLPLVWPLKILNAPLCTMLQFLHHLKRKAGVSAKQDLPVSATDWPTDSRPDCLIRPSYPLCHFSLAILPPVSAQIRKNNWCVWVCAVLVISYILTRTRPSKQVYLIPLCHQWATLLLWVACSFITTNTHIVVYFDSIPHTPSCCPKYSPEH